MKGQGGEELSGDKCMPQYSNYCDESEKFSAKCDDKNLQIGNRVIDSLKGFQECQEIDNLYVLEDECEDSAVSTDENTAEGDLSCLAINYALTQTTLGEKGKTKIQKEVQDDRSLKAEQLRAKIWEITRLLPEQKNQLYEVLSKYQPYLTSRPGRCHRFQYNFTIEGKLPNSANTTPIPFALRNQVREQIQDMIEDGILEESYSDFVNPLTVVTLPTKASVFVWMQEKLINRWLLTRLPHYLYVNCYRNFMGHIT
jgi:hypothetical protein